VRLPSGPVLLLFAGLTACGNSSGPSLHGAPYFEATVNGAAWNADSSVAVLYESICDTSLVVSGVQLSSGTREELLIAMQPFHRSGGVVLADTSTRNFAAYWRTLPPMGGPPVQEQFWTTAAATGNLHIDGLTTDDSLITGRFAFRARTIPDTGPQDAISGRFRARYFLQPVFVVSCGP
jgi:hypothetical protein